jgi:hypothetical protein
MSTEYTNHVEMNSDLVSTGTLFKGSAIFTFRPVTGTDTGSIPPTYSSNPVISDGGGGGGGTTQVTGADAQSWSDSI